MRVTMLGVPSTATMAISDSFATAERSRHSSSAGTSGAGWFWCTPTTNARDRGGLGGQSCGLGADVFDELLADGEVDECGGDELVEGAVDDEFPAIVTATAATARLTTTAHTPCGHL